MVENSIDGFSSQAAGDCFDDDDWRAFDVSADRYERRKRIWLEFDRGDWGIVFSLWLILASVAFVVL